MEPALWQDIPHPGVLDADLFAQLGAFFLEPFHPGRQAHPTLDMVGGCAAGVQDGETRQGEGVQGGGFHAGSASPWGEGP